MKKADLSAGIISLLLGLFALWEASKMPSDQIMKIGPNFFPNILAGFLIFFSLLLIIKALKGQSQGSVAPFNFAHLGVRRGLITLVAGIVFCVVLEPLGFAFSTILFLSLMMYVIGKRNYLLIAGVPPLITFGIWLVFEKILHLTLPLGVLELLGGTDGL